jgi:hypothetical protein
VKILAKLAFFASLAVVAVKSRKRAPNLSVFKIRQQYGMWMLHIQFNRKSLENAKNKYSAGSMNKENILSYIKSTVDLKANGKDVVLNAADMLMKDENVDIMWTINEVPAELLNLSVQIKTCSENKNHCNVLNFYYKGTKYHYVLSSENDFSIFISF